MRLAETPVYVIHGRALAERRARLEPVLAGNGVQATWITHPDPPDLTPELRRAFHRRSRRQWWRRSRLTGKASFRPLRPEEIVVGIKHLLAFEQIAAGEREWALVLEDDAILVDDFAARFDAELGTPPPDADMIFLGNCAGLRIDAVEPGRIFYRKSHPATKCMDSYLIRREAAATLREAAVPFVLPIDWELNWQLARLDLVVYWIEPPLVSQGSESGLYASSIRY